MTFMTVNPTSNGVPAPPKPASPAFVLLSPKETAKRLKVSFSWLAKARMRGDGPPYIPVGRVHALQRSRLAPMDEVPAAAVDQPAVIVARMTEGEYGPKRRQAFAGRSAREP